MKMETKNSPPCPYTVTVRRNPPRRARPTTTATKCLQPSAHPSSSTAPEVPSFPIDEILAMEVPKNPKPNSDSDSETLRVFLRIRPLFPSTSFAKGQNPKSRAKNAWPQNPSKKKNAKEKTTKKKTSSDGCITVNDSQSVTLFPPLALQESKRFKSEVYEGFSHVFPPDSSQEEVYEKMVNPLVEDFLRGKSCMLATLGPSGSGKTHTVFGRPRDPGVVPRTLQRIFKPNADTASDSRRSLSISIFEILSERGKGEKLFDLAPGGAELSMQQSTVKGLKEVIVSDAKEAESLVSQAMLRRLTAMTNSNTQSSRSQCIINIRSVANDSNGEDDAQANNAVLSIVDLAGAEREKETGNQGARLLESNFINNTSMVFGLCLRSLLEHQKNPKRLLQKHFQNSLLTRYLRDYLEGKKRMALILTVKSGEEDYLDASYLLRQASPFMRIRFDNVEEQSDIPCNKRQKEALSRREKPKRMKISGPDACATGEGKIYEDECHTPRQSCSKESNHVDLAEKDRSYHILQNFSKALWSVLKQYGEKLKVAEHEIQHLTENLELEKTRNVELEKKLGDFKSCCACSQQKSADTETKFKPIVELKELDSSNFKKSNVDLRSLNFCLSEYNCTPKSYDSSPRQDQVISSPKNVELHSTNKMASGAESLSEKCDSNFEQNQNILSQVQVKEEAFTSDSIGKSTENEQAKSLDADVVVGSTNCVQISRHECQVKEEAFPSDSKGLGCVDDECIYNTPARRFDIDVVVGSSLCVDISQQKDQTDATFSGMAHSAEELHGSRCLETDDTSRNPEVTVNSYQPLVMRRDSCSSVELDLDQLINEDDQELLNLPKTVKEDVESSGCCTESRIENPEELLDPSTSVQEEVIENIAISKECKVVDSLSSESVKENVVIASDCKAVHPLRTEQKVDTPQKPGKPKRRLLPASSVLLRDFSTLEIDDKSEKRKGNRGGKKFYADERNRTQGSVSLLRMLQSNIRS